MPDDFKEKQSEPHEDPPTFHALPAGSQTEGALAVRAAATGAVAVGALAIGAFAVGALALWRSGGLLLANLVSVLWRLTN